ncbi:hypothetical protein [Spirosoma sp. KUDC1026]|uniref:hypothetical protein n=1 Tax=Spirosoma sp. KUDC1026 TaxID=2745947 RepID=UPI00159B90C8|nr:hypothetical protein [Spirosoma sp. KUDC1026]QKZ14329.1 hypothetical protein HU175_17520 [Spirosoma sp. KUDC1026]
MENKTFFLLLGWAICLAGALNIGFSLLTRADTALNVLGVVFLAVFLFVSVLTKCFTKNPFNR